MEEPSAITDEKIKSLAHIVHEANRAFCEEVGDTSQVAWDDAPKDIQDSAIAGVKAIADNPDLTPEQSHEVWSENKKASGWSYGPTKDAAKKTHPCLVPYKDLDVRQRYKDHLFGAIVKSYLDFIKHTAPKKD